MKVFAVRDKASDSYLTPFFAPHEAMAIRQFHLLRTDSSTFVAQFPQDFDLFLLGEFDERTGHFTELSPCYLQSAILAAKESES